MSGTITVVVDGAAASTIEVTGPTTVEVSAPGPQGPLFFPPRAVSITYPSAAENVTLLWAESAMTIDRIVAHVDGATPSVTFSLKHAADRSAAGTDVVTGGSTVTSLTTGNSITTFNNAGIAAGSWLWLTTSAVSGTVSQFHATVYFA